MTTSSVRLQEDVEAPLEELVERLRRSKNWLINQAIREFVERHRIEGARWADTLQALDSVEAGQVVSGEAVHDWLATWGTAEEKLPPGR